MPERELSETAKQQIKDDDELIPNVGMSRTIVQQGSITGKDGSIENVKITTVRTRNADGGVDVKMCVPKPLGMKGKAKEIGG